jgi:hypothetical protein
MSDDLKTAKTALAKPHHDMEAINKLAKPSYLSVIEQMERTLEPIRRQQLEISRALELSGAAARISAFPWIAVAAGWTMSSSNSSGARSSMNACICTLLKPAPKLVPKSADGSTFTIGSGLIAAWEACLRTLTTNKGL